MNKKLVKNSVIAGAVIIALIVIGYVIYKSVKNAETRRNNNKILNALESEYKNDEATLTDVQVNTLVTKLKSAFYSGLLGLSEDESAIYDVYNNVNSRSDIMKLEKCFGVYNDKTLTEHVTSLLSLSEIEHLNNIIASKGINYKY